MSTASRKINPNATKAAVFTANLSDAKCYPRFIRGISFENFRHIKDLKLDFVTPVTVISGSNKSGKTTALLSIACSHFDFKKRNYANGRTERQTWSSVLKFTSHDVQAEDWTYHVSIKTGAKDEDRRGQRKAATKKWNGVGKKESQIQGVQVVYMDLDRILPARYFSSALHKKAQLASASPISGTHQKFIDESLSYILEHNYELRRIAAHLGEDILGFSGKADQYSSYNCASGEDVLSRILIDAIEAPKQSLILIDEIELGLHPGVQRRLMDIIFEISDRDQKQFIVTTHSATVMSCVPERARIFIDRKGSKHEAISPISTHAALSKMDSISYPLIDLFCEDEVASKIIHKALEHINKAKLPGISSKLFNVIISGSADDTFTNFEVRNRTYSKVKTKCGHVCVLDGDMKLQTTKGARTYPQQQGLHFLPGTEPPEKILCDLYEKNRENPELRYHIENSNVHCLFQKMVELDEVVSHDAAFEVSWAYFLQDSNYSKEFGELVDFLIEECKRYSPDL